METEVVDTTVAVQELTERVLRLEQEVADLRQNVTELKTQPATNGLATINDHSANQEELSQAVAQMFRELGITARAKGVAYLRRMYKEFGLENLEMSQQLIEARDE